MEKQNSNKKKKIINYAAIVLFIFILTLFLVVSCCLNNGGLNDEDIDVPYSVNIQYVTEGSDEMGYVFEFNEFGKITSLESDIYDFKTYKTWEYDENHKLELQKSFYYNPETGQIEDAPFEVFIYKDYQYDGNKVIGYTQYYSIFEDEELKEHPSYKVVLNYENDKLINKIYYDYDYFSHELTTNYLKFSLGYNEDGKLEKVIQSSKYGTDEETFESSTTFVYNNNKIQKLQLDIATALDVKFDYSFEISNENVNCLVESLLAICENYAIGG